MFNNYGPKSNSEFLMGYGFTIKDNIEDHFIFPFQLSTKDPLYRQKQQLISNNSIYIFLIVMLIINWFIDLSNIYYIKYDYIPDGLIQCFRMYKYIFIFIY